MADEARQVMDAEEVRRCIKRISHEIIERNRGAKSVVLVGIRTRGVPMAERIAAWIKKEEGLEVPVGSLDITLYRDDLMIRHPKVEKTEIPFDINGKRVVVTDEVVYTGRTIRAAMDALMDFGRPASIQLAVLVDRGHRELPIRPDFIGRNIPTAHDEEVRVSLKECDGEDKVAIVRMQDPAGS
jgi:pyrimidine operon attenuation protein/uracil phosphoribosyltransferase